MRGVLLTAIARRITRAETFDSLVAPALADLQYEAASRHPLGRHYAALVIVIATALLRDLRVDVQLTFGAPRVWQRVAAWWAGFGLLYVGAVLYADTPWHLLDATGQATALANALIGGLPAGLPPALVAAVFHLRRESAAPHRTIAVAAVTYIVAAAAIQITAASVQPVANRVLFESASRVVAQHRPGAGLNDRTPYPGHWQSWLDTKRERSAPSPMLAGGVGSAAAGFTFSYLLNLAPYVMFGVILARGRRWTVLLRVLGLFATYAFVQIFTMWLGMPILTGHGHSSDAIRQMAAMFLTALAWLLGLRMFLIPLLPIYALTFARKIPRRRTSR